MLKSDMCYEVKITVLKKLKVEDVYNEYAKSDVPVECTEEDVGDSYLSVNYERPDKFCIYAWEGLKNKVKDFALGGPSPYTKNENIAIHCCNDGLHPVIFRLERYQR